MLKEENSIQRDNLPIIQGPGPTMGFEPGDPHQFLKGSMTKQCCFGRSLFCLLCGHPNDSCSAKAINKMTDMKLKAIHQRMGVG